MTFSRIFSLSASNFFSLSKQSVLPFPSVLEREAMTASLEAEDAAALYATNHKYGE
jgi:hypothetical protein